MITVFGAGSWGTALAQSFCQAGQEVLLWCRDSNQSAIMAQTHHNPKRLSNHQLHPALRFTSDLEEAARNDEWVLVTPAQTLREMLTRLKPYWNKNKEILCASKGIEIDTQLLPHQVAQEVIANVSFGDVSGPSHAEEVIIGLPACLVVAHKNQQKAMTWQKRLSHSALRLYTSNDLIGVEVGGAVKNVIAIASGFVHAKKLGDNAAAALVTRGLAEMTRLAVALGGNPSTLAGLAGIGDLMVTAFSKHSRNFCLGELLAQGHTLTSAKEQLGQVAEGAYTAKALQLLLSKLDIEMPLCDAVWHVLLGELSATDALVQLMGRDLKPEAEKF